MKEFRSTTAVGGWPPSRGVFLNVLSEDVDDWASQLDRILELPDIGHVELWIEELLTASGEAALAQLVSGHSTTVHAPFVGVSLVHPWDELRSISVNRLRRLSDLANRIGARVMTVHPGSAPAACDRTSLLDRLADSYRRVAVDAGPLRIAVENMVDRPSTTREAVSTVDDFEALVARTPDVAFTFDVGHALQNSDDSFMGFLGRAGDRVVNIHLHDGFRGGAAHLELGHGDLDVRRLVETLHDCRYAGFLTLETLGWTATERSWSTWRQETELLNGSRRPRRVVKIASGDNETPTSRT